MRSKCLILAMLVLVRLASAQVLKPEEIYKKVLPSVLTLQVETARGERFVGSAFFALENGLAITSWHVISDATNVSARLSDNHPVRVCGLVDKDELHDLALIRLDLTNSVQVELNTTNPPVGARTYVIGAPKGFEFSITDGLLSQIQKVDGYDQFQVSCPISGGNSGGPLINERGEVIGVTSWTKRDAQNLSFATPATFISNLNTSLPFIPWTTAAHLPSVAAKTKVSEKPVASVKTATPEKNIADLKQLLKKSIGKQITVVIVDQDDQQEFEITVPPDLLKGR